MRYGFLFGFWLLVGAGLGLYANSAKQADQLQMERVDTELALTREFELLNAAWSAHLKCDPDERVRFDVAAPPRLEATCVSDNDGGVRLDATGLGLHG